MTARPASTRDLQPWFTTLLDLAGCHRFEMAIHLYEHETADFHFESWPAQVRSKVVDYFKEWAAENPAREVIAITFAVALDARGRQCVAIVHHADRREERQRKPKPPAPAPAAGGGGPSAAPAAACASCSE